MVPYDWKAVSEYACTGGEVCLVWLYVVVTCMYGVRARECMAPAGGEPRSLGA